jgi:hypothetical protein
MTSFAPTPARSRTRPRSAAPARTGPLRGGAVLLARAFALFAVALLARADDGVAWTRLWTGTIDGRAAALLVERLPQGPGLLAVRWEGPVGREPVVVAKQAGGPRRVSLLVPATNQDAASGAFEGSLTLDASGHWTIEVAPASDGSLASATCFLHVPTPEDTIDVQVRDGRGPFRKARVVAMTQGQLLFYAFVLFPLGIALSVLMVRWFLDRFGRRG